MKRLYSLSMIAAFILFFVSNSFAFVSPAPIFSKPTPSTSIVEPTPSPFAGMTIKDFLALTPKKYRELTGQKMSLSQKISLKLAQYKVKRAVKKNKQIELTKFAQGVDTSDFSIGGLVLGLLLGPIGVLIAYLIGDHSVIKWAWIGGAIWLIIFLLVVIL
jgi:hypothetical protein